jgi:hypothetical protein
MNRRNDRRTDRRLNEQTTPEVWRWLKLTKARMWRNNHAGYQSGAVTYLWGPGFDIRSCDREATLLGSVGFLRRGFRFPPTHYKSPNIVYRAIVRLCKLTQSRFTFSKRSCLRRRCLLALFYGRVTISNAIWKQVIYTERIFGPDLVLHQARQTICKITYCIDCPVEFKPNIRQSV